MVPDADAPRRAPRRGKDRPGACALDWDAVDLPAWGSASRATFWVALEQPGPWGRAALTESRLDPDLGARLEQGFARAGGRILLQRVIGPEQEPPTGALGPGASTARPRRVFVSGGMPRGRPWLLAGFVERPERLLDLPTGALAAGDADAVRAAVPELSPHPEPVALVCTNGKRDVCCAVRGRPVAAAAATARPGRVWECSHTGGHRFAPTAVLLPHGTTIGRAEADDVVAALDAAADDRLAPRFADPRTLRGLSHLWPAAQAADGHVRAQESVLDLTALDVEKVAGGPLEPYLIVRPEGSDVTWEFVVSHVDGRAWRVRVTDRDSGLRLHGSCGTEPVEAHAFETRTLP